VTPRCRARWGPHTTPTPGLVHQHYGYCQAPKKKVPSGGADVYGCCGTIVTCLSREESPDLVAKDEARV
jgi:hypothetical protein